MASVDERIEDNVPGPFYVDLTCIDCDACRRTAPEHFIRNDDRGYTFVFKQPETDEEFAVCREALEGCPSESIGEDGETG